MATASDLITRALRKINAIGPGETPAPEDSETGLSALQMLIDSWATQRLAISTVTRTLWTISQTQDYTVGTGATISVARPATTDLTVRFIDTSTSPDTEMSLVGPITDDAWALIPQKAQTAIWPTLSYYNPTFGATGFGTLSLWPVPTSATLQGAFYCPVALTEPAALTTPIYTPPGYRRALVLNLAMELLPDFQKVPPPTLQQQADDALAWVKRSNIRLADLSVDIALTRPNAPRSNIYTGVA